MGTIAAGVFKARCLELMDEVARTGEPIVVTKYGRPVARLVPLDDRAPARALFGRARGTVVSVADDTFVPEPELWDALRE